mmetsp:Transcript_1449/g.8887  ORF Transcript_1449/g.8887 Transcript_1449/m.8887 type:complete len:222 (+) Transcript_1449:738-1403(+)
MRLVDGVSDTTDLDGGFSCGTSFSRLCNFLASSSTSERCSSTNSRGGNFRAAACKSSNLMAFLFKLVATLPDSNARNSKNASVAMAMVSTASLETFLTSGSNRMIFRTILRGMVKALFSFIPRLFPSSSSPSTSTFSAASAASFSAISAYFRFSSSDLFRHFSPNALATSATDTFSAPPATSSSLVLFLSISLNTKYALRFPRFPIVVRSSGQVPAKNTSR